jgi:hypothetical protein
MFKTNGVVNTTLVDAFKLEARKAFLAGVAAKTNLSVTNAAGALQLARVQVTDIRAGAAANYIQDCIQTCLQHLCAVCGFACLAVMPLALVVVQPLCQYVQPHMRAMPGKQSVRVPLKHTHWPYSLMSCRIRHCRHCLHAAAWSRPDCFEQRYHQ